MTDTVCLQNKSKPNKIKRHDQFTARRVFRNDKFTDMASFPARQVYKHGDFTDTTISETIVLSQDKNNNFLIS